MTTSEKSSDSTTPLIANAYVVLDKREQEVVTSASDIVNAASAVELNRPAVRRTDVAYSQIPEARDLSWEDDFFDSDDIIAVFDLEYDKMEDYYTNLGWVCYGATLCCPGPIFFWGCMLGVPCFLKQNVTWSVRSQHVAVTRDGVRFVKEKRPTCWGLPFSDAGMIAKTIPFDKISQCIVHEPAGTTCCVDNRLSTVAIDTASWQEGRSHELSIAGLRDPHAFERLVWAMKRQYASGATSLSSSSAMDGRD